MPYRRARVVTSAAWPAERGRLLEHIETHAIATRSKLEPILR